MRSLFSKNDFERLSKAIPTAVFAWRFVVLLVVFRDVLFDKHQRACCVLLCFVRSLGGLLLSTYQGFLSGRVEPVREWLRDQRSSALYERCFVQHDRSDLSKRVSFGCRQVLRALSTV